MTQEQIDAFANDCTADILKTECDPTDYCIIVTAGKENAMRTRFVYKSVERFKERALKDMSSIDSMFAINAQLWIFD